MTQRKNEDQEIEFKCENPCGNDTWDVAGRFNAEGEFEPHDLDDACCDRCGWRGDPVDEDIVVAEV